MLCSHTVSRAETCKPMKALPLAELQLASQQRLRQRAELSLAVGLAWRRTAVDSIILWHSFTMPQSLVYQGQESPTHVKRKLRVCKSQGNCRASAALHKGKAKTTRAAVSKAETRANKQICTI